MTLSRVFTACAVCAIPGIVPCPVPPRGDVCAGPETLPQVMRNGVKTSVDISELVVGDVMFVAAGMCL